MKALRRPQNRKYTTYRNAARARPSLHGRRQHAQKVEVDSYAIPRAF